MFRLYLGIFSKSCENTMYISQHKYKIRHIAIADSDLNWIFITMNNWAKVDAVDCQWYFYD